MLSSGEGEGAQFAMEIITEFGEAVGARRLMPITRAHIDSCLYQGQSGLDFADRLLEVGALIRTDPPDGMESMSVQRTDRGAVIVQARWRSAADLRAFRASPEGSRIFRAMSDCCSEPPQTYVGMEDAALSHFGVKQPKR